MFFADHVTPFEQRTGEVSRAELLQRCIAAKEVLLASSSLGYMSAEISIAVGDKTYELLISLSPDPDETCPDALCWEEWTTVDRCEASSSGSYSDFAVVPLTWAGAVDALSTLFGLDPNVVWNTGIDLNAYRDSDGAGKVNVPLPGDRAKYSLRALHGDECPYPKPHLGPS